MTTEISQTELLSVSEKMESSAIDNLLRRARAQPQWLPIWMGRYALLFSMSPLTRRWMRMDKKELAERNLICARMGLDQWNEEQTNPGVCCFLSRSFVKVYTDSGWAMRIGKNMELARPIRSCKGFSLRMGFFLHANFKDKPVSGSDDEVKLFFCGAETHSCWRLFCEDVLSCRSWCLTFMITLCSIFALYCVLLGGEVPIEDDVSDDGWIDNPDGGSYDSLDEASDDRSEEDSDDVILQCLVCGLEMCQPPHGYDPGQAS
ncbi:hypothetical protein AKJ16_DCAP19510 [Drosera capensis]